MTVFESLRSKIKYTVFTTIKVTTKVNLPSLRVLISFLLNMKNMAGQQLFSALFSFKFNLKN